MESQVVMLTANITFSWKPCNYKVLQIGKNGESYGDLYFFFHSTVLYINPYVCFITLATFSNKTDFVTLVLDVVPVVFQ